jgi:hypothetical protein
VFLRLLCRNSIVIAMRKITLGVYGHVVGSEQRARLSEQAAKKKFEYGLEKTRLRIVRLLKAAKAKEPA